MNQLKLINLMQAIHNKPSDPIFMTLTVPEHAMFGLDEMNAFVENLKQKFIEVDPNVDDLFYEFDADGMNYSCNAIGFKK